jgi:hypothetical protein
MFGAPQETRWVNLLVPIAFIIFGCVIIARPQIVRDMVEKNFPDHKLTQETQESTVISGRIIGSLFIVSEIYTAKVSTLRFRLSYFSFSFVVTGAHGPFDFEFSGGGPFAF